MRYNSEELNQSQSKKADHEESCRNYDQWRKREWKRKAFRVRFNYANSVKYQTCSLMDGDSRTQSLNHFIANGNEGITALPLKLLSERLGIESSYRAGKPRSQSSLRSFSNIVSGSHKQMRWQPSRFK